jgi:hypothetical protein
MELITSAVQSYQKNQNLAGWVTETEKSTSIKHSEAIKEVEDDSVSIGETRQVYNWVAQEFPDFTQSAATLNRVNQFLFEYDLVSLQDIERANTLLNEKPEQNIFVGLTKAFESTSSYQERQAILNIMKVYKNLEAAAERAAA